MSSNKGQEYLIRLSLAVYRVTDCFPDQEPLYSLIRERVLWVMEDVTLLGLNNNPQVLAWEKKAALYREAIQNIWVLKRYLRIAQAQEWVGPENCAILIKEYQALQNKLLESGVRNEKGGYGEAVSFGFGQRELQTEGGDSTPGFVSDQQETEAKPGDPREVRQGAGQVGRIKQGESAKERAGKGGSGGKREIVLDKIGNKRQQKILRILGQNEKAQLGQMKRFFPQVTERTLRRDINKLLKKKLVQRKGGGKATFYKLRAGVVLR